MSGFLYKSNVSDEEFKAAVASLDSAIAEMDTPEEVARFTGRVLLAVGKIAISHFGFGPAITILEEVFGSDHAIIDVVKLMGDENESG